MKGKKHLYLFLLCLFLFPFVEKGLHDFSHRNDFSCSVKTEKHIHNEEHNCFICDFNIPAATEPTPHSDGFFLTVTSFNYSSFSQHLILPKADYKFSPRSPPLV